MSIDRAVLLFAGFMVLLSLLLTHFVHPAFVWFSAFIGANMIQSAFTGFCPAAMIFRSWVCVPAPPSEDHTMQKSAFVALLASITVPGLTVAQAADLKLTTVSIPELKAVYGQVQPRNSVLARARLGGTVDKLTVTEGDPRQGR